MSPHSPASPDPVLKPRDLGQILDQNFRVFGRSWRSLVPIGLFAAVPGVFVSLIMLGMMDFLNFPAFGDPVPDVTVYAPLDGAAVLAGFGLILIIYLALLLLYPLYKGALIDAAARAVLHMEPVPLSESFRVGASRYGAMLGSHVLIVLLWIVAVPALVLAGLVVLAFLTLPLGLAALATFTAFTGHAVVIEQKGAGRAIARSFALARSRFWPLLGTGIVYTLLSSVLSYLVAGPVSFAASLAAGLTGSITPLALVSVVEALAVALIAPFMAVGLTLVYFDTRIRREGYDLETMARQQVESGPAEVRQ